MKAFTGNSHLMFTGHDLIQELSHYESCQNLRARFAKALVVVPKVMMRRHSATPYRCLAMLQLGICPWEIGSCGLGNRQATEMKAGALNPARC